MRIAHVILACGGSRAESLLADIVESQRAAHDVQVVVLNDLFDAGLVRRLRASARCISCDDAREAARPGRSCGHSGSWPASDQDVVHCHDLSMIKVLLLARPERRHRA